MKKFILAAFFIITATLFDISPAYAEDYYVCNLGLKQMYIDSDNIYEYRSSIGTRAFFSHVKIVQNGNLIDTENLYFEFEPSVAGYVFYTDSNKRRLGVLYYSYATDIFFLTTKLLGLNVRA